MPHALLLSPDDQAVSAITGVLEEMSVTCERPLDGVSAAQKLNSHSFDLVLVDCENLPAAKLIFDVCRRGKNGHNPVPIAIVDGRAGLPTAFRLGAELILTKPVAKDQARNTVRTAVSRLRKDVQANESIPAQPVSAATASTEERAHGAAATAVSEQLTNFAEPAPSFVPSAAPSSASTATLSAPALTTMMHSAVDEIGVDTVTLKSRPQPTTPSASLLSESSSAATVPASSKPAHPLTPSDDPVLAELERTELEESELDSSRVASSGPDKPPSVQPVAESVAPVVSSHRQRQPKGRGPLVALLVLVLAAGGFYAAWMYQPGFQAIVQPQIDQVLALAGLAHKPQSLPPAPTPKPASPSAQPTPVTATAPGSPTDPNQTQPTVAGPANGSATDAPTTPAVVTAPAQPAPATVVAKPASGATRAATPVVITLDTSKSGDSKRDASAATLSNAPLQGESSAIILSSKGAEKRLAYSPAPKYPAAARSGEAQGTVVLKAVVDENGNVAGLRLVEGNANLATAAIQAVKQWRYRPYIRDGKAEPFQTVVIVDFQRP